MRAMPWLRPRRRARQRVAVQGNLAHKKFSPARTLPYDSASGPSVVLRGRGLFMSEVPLYEDDG